MQVITIESNQAGQRFDKLLHKYLPEAPSSFLYKMLRKKNITLNGKKAEGKEILAVGDEVKLFLAEDTIAKFSGNSTQNTLVPSGLTSLSVSYTQAYKALKGITVLYEDEHVLILNKPAGILTQKATDKDMSLNEWMIGYLLHTGSITPEELRLFRPSVCNRLDRNTSGLVLCSKSLAGSQALSKLIQERTIRKFYRTIVGGRLAEASRIEGFLHKDNRTNRVTVTTDRSGQQSEKSSYIQTAYTPLTGKNNMTYLEVELITGKTHQIRAHLSSIGYPLLGDSKYGSNQWNQAASRYGLKWQLLHAYRLEFPVLEGALAGLSRKQIIAPLPPKFMEILKGEGLT